MRTLPKNITKELLVKLYIEEQKSCLKVGKELEKSIKQVSRYLERFGIKARSFSTKGLSPQIGKVLSDETRHKIRMKAIGRKIPIDVRIRMGSKGEKNPGYIDGRTPNNKRIRHSIEYKLWREAVFVRDNFTCQICLKHGGDLNADHIKSFADYPESRTSIENGRTLCVPCHRKTENFGRNNNLIHIHSLPDKGT